MSDPLIHDYARAARNGVTLRWLTNLSPADLILVCAERASALGCPFCEVDETTFTDPEELDWLWSQYEGHITASR